MARGPTEHSGRQNATSVTATFPDGEQFDCTGIVDKDVRHDLALVRVREFGRRVLKISPAPMTVGDTVRLAAVKSGALGILPVSVAAVKVEDGLKFYRLAGQIPGANDGSPVLDADGDVIGVHVTLVQGGTSLDMALPSAYILALEPSLPVRPWASSASAQASGSASSGSAPAAASIAADTMLAATFDEIHDLWAQWTPISQQIYGTTRYTNPNFPLYKVQSEIDAAIAQLQWIKSTDSTMAKLTQAAGEILALERQAIGLDIKCATLNKAASPDQHIAAAEDDANQAAEMFGSVPGRIAPMQPTLSQFAARSPAFLAALSSEMRYFLGIAKRKSKLDLGAYVLSSEPMYVIGVVPHGLAEKLGLQGGDLLVSIAGHTFKPTGDLDAFTLLIQANAGNKLEIVIKRGDKTKTLRKKIPANVIQKYGSA